jgi:hypothetical protein
MSPDLQELEANLRALRPAGLDRALLARLDQAADGTLGILSPAIAPFENSLRRIQPARLSASLMAALDATLTAPAATADAAIVPFPQVPPAPAAHLRHGRRQMLAAAAAVALLGAAAALFIPGKHSPRSAAAPAAPSPQAPAFAAAPTSPASRNFVPAAFNTGLSQASDEGVLWQSKNQPTRVVKVVYWDRVTLVNPEGKKIEYEKPRVEYILVPEEID